MRTSSRSRLLALLLLVLTVVPSAQAPPVAAYDILITGGRIVDGAGGRGSRVMWAFGAIGLRRSEPSGVPRPRCALTPVGS